jgi:hypothetical protein
MSICLPRKFVSCIFSVLIAKCFCSAVLYKRGRQWNSYSVTEFDVRNLKFSQLCVRGLLVLVTLRRWVIWSRHLEKTYCPHVRGSMRPRNLGSDYLLAQHRILNWNSIIFVWDFIGRCASVLRIGKFFFDFFFTVLVIWVCTSACLSSCGLLIFIFH